MENKKVKILNGDINALYSNWHEIFTNIENEELLVVELLHVKRVFNKFLKQEINFKELRDWSSMVLFSDSYILSNINKNILLEVLHSIEELQRWNEKSLEDITDKINRLLTNN